MRNPKWLTKTRGETGHWDAKTAWPSDWPTAYQLAAAHRTQFDCQQSFPSLILFRIRIRLQIRKMNSELSIHVCVVGDPSKCVPHVTVENDMLASRRRAISLRPVALSPFIRPTIASNKGYFLNRSFLPLSSNVSSSPLQKRFFSTEPTPKTPTSIGSAQELPKRARVVVIGGGIIGTSAAYHLV